MAKAAVKQKPRTVKPKPPPDKPKPQNVNPITPRFGAWPADRARRLSVEQLYPYALNAMMHTNEDVDLVASAIRRFGWTVPVIVRKNGEIIAGHARVMAARRLGLTEVSGIEIADDEWTEEDRIEYGIWDNQSARRGVWSKEQLKVNLDRLKSAGRDIGATGFDPKTLVSFTASLGPTPPTEFQAFGENLATEHSCPECGYRWSGKADAAPKPAAQPEQPAPARAKRTGKRK